MNEHVVNLAASALTSWKSYEGGGTSINNENSNNEKNNKHGLDYYDHANNSNAMKKARIEPHSHSAFSSNLNAAATMVTMMPSAQPPAAVLESVAALSKPQLRPYPFFYYKDYSTVQDEDPLTPVTFPGRVPNFPAKLHAILSRSDLKDVIDWLPHGRAWRVLKPREFEMKIIPKVRL